MDLFGSETSGAKISPDGQYRYSLWRIWNEDKPRVCFIMLNPSTADHTEDDNTITRCIRFAQSWGYGSIEVVNLFAFRSTDPGKLLKVMDPNGPNNYIHVSVAIQSSEMIICAWGNPNILKKLKPTELPKKISEFEVDYHCLGRCQDGTPRHPLYLKKDIVPIPFDPYN